jgi:O-antigen/teichoic acid export membrane protein
MVKRIKRAAYNALRKSERYTKTDMLYLSKGSFWLVVGQSAIMISGFGLSVAFANLIPKDIYGNYKYILSLAVIVGIFSLSGMSTAVTQAVARGFDGALRQGFRSSLRWGILTIMVAFSTAAYYFLRGNDTLAFSMLIVGVASPLIASGSLYASYLQGKKDFRTHTHYNVIRNVIPFVILIALILVTDNPIILVLGYFGSNTLSVLLAYALTIRKYRPADNQSHVMLGYGKHLSVIEGINTFASYLDKVLVFHYLGAIELAVYSFAILIPDQIKGGFGTLSFLAMPKLAAKEPSEVRYGLYQKSLLLTGMLIVVMGLYIVAAPTFYHFFFPNYEESIFYSQLAILGLIANISLLPGTAFRASGAVKEINRTVIWSSLVQIVCLFIGVYYFGIMGAILGGVIGRMFKVVITYYFYHRFAR